jgi:tetratricopeptide (TPR) repeat protein
MAKKQPHQPRDQAADQAAGAAAGWRARIARLPRWKLAALGALALAILGVAAGAVWQLRSPSEPEPAELLARALAALEAEQNQTARQLAQQLAATGNRDADFPGALPFILGVVSSREARQSSPPRSFRLHRRAVTQLEEAESRGVTAQQRPQWAMALAESLCALRQSDRAIPLLFEAFRTFPPGRVDAGLLLLQAVTDRREAAHMQASLEVADLLAADDTVDESTHDRVLVERARLLHAMNREEDSQQILAGVLNPALREQAANLLRAQSAMDRGQPRLALQPLESIVGKRGAATEFTAQAHYLLGECALGLEEFENAVDAFTLARDAWHPSHEAVAALVGAATALRRLGRHEEALGAFQQALRAVQDAGGFYCRWMTADQLQAAVLEAAEAWIAEGTAAEAVALADAMGGVVEAERAFRLAALAAHQQALDAERRLQAAPPDQRSTLAEKARSLWVQSARRHALLAEHLVDAVEHRRCITTSADHSFRGKDFAAARDQYDRLIGEPRADDFCQSLLRRAKCHAALDALPAALRDARSAIAADPSNPAVFEARYLVGHFALESNDADTAEKAWRALLEAPELTPAAAEWRGALFSLGRLLYHKNAIEARASPSANAGAAAAGLDECAALTEEFLTRYPTTAEAAEARYMLAGALKRRAEMLRAEAAGLAASPGVPAAIQAARRRCLRALAHYQELVGRLSAVELSGGLDEAEAAMLTNSLHGVAGCHFLLENNEEAIKSYSVAAGRGKRPGDALMAYVQISRCYARQGQFDRAAQALAHAGLLLQQQFEEESPSDPSLLSRAEWQQWLGWAQEIAASRQSGN